jgi:hypothetical protein
VWQKPIAAPATTVTNNTDSLVNRPFCGHQERCANSGNCGLAAGQAIDAVQN